MQEALGFLELKHSAYTVFLYDMDDPEAVIWGEPADMTWAVAAARESDAHRSLSVQPLSATGSQTAVDGWMVPFVLDENDARVQHRGALLFSISPEVASEKAKDDFVVDASLFIENWTIAFKTLQLQERLHREQVLREEMYHERMTSIATMVTGVAHEVNTPLGVALTANDIVGSLVGQILADLPATVDSELVDDLIHATRLVTGNLSRVSLLVKSFKQLSTGQLSDLRGTYRIPEVVRDCVESMAPETRKSKIEVTIRFLRGRAVRVGVGYAGHLSQVVINLLQNTLRYAYGEMGGKVDIEVQARKR